MDAKVCGLADTNGNSDWVKAEDIDFFALKPHQIEKLPLTVKQQVIIAARSLLGQNFMSAADAIKAFRRDAYISYFSFQGVQYTEVGHLPGDNQFSIIFPRGSLRAIGGTDDSDPYCL